MNNTKNKSNKQDNNQTQKNQHEQGPKKGGRNANMLHQDVKYHEQERIETRMFD